MPARIGSNITLPDLSSAMSLSASTSNFCLSYILPDRSGPPVARIPPEVLQEIFLFTLLSPNKPSASGAIFPPRTYTPVISPSHFATPFPLSHVNRQWRAVINNTPALWRSITVVAPHPNHFYRTELWLERSRNHSLDIAIRQHNVTEEISDATDKLLAMFAVHSARWRSVKFLFHLGIPAAAANALVDLQRLPRPRLQDVAILAGHDHDDDDDDEDEDDSVDGPPASTAGAVYQALQRIPSLRRVVWKASFSTPHMRIGAQLRFLELRSYTCIKELADNIVGCPNLAYLSVQHLVALPSFETHGVPIVLPALAVLILTMAIHPGMSPPKHITCVPFLERFAMPALVQLQLKNIIDHADEADDDTLPKPYTRTAVQALLQRSQCRLKSLNVHILEASTEEAQAWLTIPEIDAVEMLCVSGAEIDDAVLALLTRAHGDASSARARFPRLRQLGLGLCEAYIDEEVLLRMLESRFWTPVSVGAVDDPVKTQQELRTAHVWVKECTPNMMKYEKMINMCAERMQDGRVLRIAVGRATL